jgi:tripartite-type tricarboxylate transporter receptor subunit TctC
MSCTRRNWLLNAGAWALGGASGGANAQLDDGRPLHVIVSAGPGSFPDQVARRVGDGLAAIWKRPVVIDNRPGAGGIAAIMRLMEARADGSTIALGTMSQLVFNPFLFRQLSYDVDRDIEPIGAVLDGSMMIVAHPAFPASTLSALIEQAHARPVRSIDFAVPAAASPPHVVLAALMKATSTTFNVVPYRTGSDALVQVAGGQVALFIDAVSVVGPYVEAGRLKALAVTGIQRVDRFPAVPTVAEQGVANFDGSAWMGLIARKGTPPAVVARCNESLGAVLRSPSMREFLEANGARPIEGTPEALAARWRGDANRWGPVIRSLGITLD